MPSILNAQAVVPDDHASVWKQRILRSLTSASIYHLLFFLGDSTVMLITFGGPYIHYRMYRPDREENNPNEAYSQIIKALDTLWDQQSGFLLCMLPALFPMVSSSGLPQCSSASFMATMTFTFGVVNVATRIIYKHKIEALQKKHAVNEWLKASEKSWRGVQNKSFWILLSLPSVGFFWCVGLLISTVILTFWERSIVGMAVSEEAQGCAINRLEGFKYIFLVMLTTSAAHFTFVTAKLHRMTVLQTAESAAAV